jgi:hypothetical protein
MKKILFTTLVLSALNASSQIRVPGDSLKKINKTDSIDFRSNPSGVKKTPADSLKWNARDSFQIDDKNPRRIHKAGRDTIH